ncbi:MAG: HAMP domain-containing sensor histidine kinase [Bacteroidota bacterium]
MRLSRIHFIIGLMSCALLGIIIIQVGQVQKAIDINEETFDMSVNVALKEVRDQLEDGKYSTKLIQVSREVDIQPAPMFADDSSQDGYIDLDENLETPHLREQRVRIRDSLAIVTETETSVPLDSGFISGRKITYLYTLNDTMLPSISEDLTLEVRGHPKIMQIVSSALQESTPKGLEMNRQLDAVQLDTMLQQALSSQGLMLKYDFWVTSDNPSQMPIQRIAFMSDKTKGKFHTVQLFPQNAYGASDKLIIAFPDESFYAIKQVWGQMALSILFVGIIMVCFGIAIQVVFRQKRLSEMKNDFINNMTHELKTPIATISLATDSINNPIVQKQEGGIERYTRIIKEENNRMNRQVERVLQAARLDRKEMQLRQESIDMHDIIHNAAQNLQLQVRRREGELRQDCQATAYHVKGDMVHLNNVIHNLLDNANKYSPEKPDIIIRTKNEGSYLTIEVEDHGIGISKQNLNQIFTRFYRVSTGNLHEVKGFGLGLSYVKSIVEAHDGHVSVKSTLGKGSTFSVSLPLSKKV